MLKILRILLVTLLLFNFAYAETIKSKNRLFSLKKIEFSDLDNWQKDDVLLALKAFLKSCNQMGKIDKEKVLSEELYNIKVKDLRNVCDIATIVAGTSVEDARTFFESWFTPYIIVDKEDGKKGLFTGYYEITIKASRTSDDNYKYPIYKRPDDLTNLPYYSRKEIEEGVLSGKNLELFYTDSKVDLAFLQIQGSGILQLNDGTTTKAVFNGRNNRDYTSIGNILIRKKYMRKKDVNATSIKEWFKNNPSKIDEVLNENESYIFFKERSDDYVRGAHGSILTPFRSIAIDYRLLPYGFPFWIETEIEDNGKKANFERLVISQDTGSAIKGSVRADIFFGNDSKAEELASNMNFNGKYYILLPKTIVQKIKLMK
ncbi:MAG: MltA domain-containing protein [Rickettsiales bacterium]|nr:MltA domain-containing protein [Rickettsiales bacterium]